MPWLRRHPIRAAVYLLLMAGAVTAGLVLRGALAGREDALLTRLARWPMVSDWVAHQGIARYSVEAVHVGPGEPGCGLRVAVTGATFALTDPGAARVHAGKTELCSSLSASAEEFQLGSETQPAMLSGTRASASTSAARVEGLNWASGLLAANEVAASFRPATAKLAGIRILASGDVALLQVNQAEAGPLQLSATAAAVEKAQVSGVKALLVREPDGRWNAVRAALEFQKAGQALLQMAERSLAELGRVLSRLRALLVWAVVLGCIVIFVLKVLLVAVPERLLGRILAAALPVALCLALYGSFGDGTGIRSFAIWSLVASAVLAAASEIVWYRKAAEWHQRVEPLLLDLVAPLLILPPLVLHGYPLALPSGIPRPTQISIAQTGAHDVDVEARLALCDRPLTARTEVSDTSAQRVRVELEPASLGIRSVSVAQAQAIGTTQPVALTELNRLKYLPGSWQRTAPLAFCVNTAVVNGEAGRQPLEECNPPAGPAGAWRLSTGAVVDLARRAGRFTSSVRTPQVSLEVRGSGDLDGAVIEELRTLDGSRIRIGSASGTLRWVREIASQFRVLRVAAPLAASTISAGSLQLNAALSRSCTAGNAELQAKVGDLRATSPGYAVTIAQSQTDLSRGSTGAIRSETGIRGLRVSGQRTGESSPWLTTDIGAVELALRGQAGSGWIPRRFDGESALSLFRSAHVPAVRFSSPFRFSADLWRGEIVLPPQTITLEQSVVSRVPSIPLRVSASARLGSLGSPLRARADARVEIPRLAFSQSPLDAELNELAAEVKWTASGAPAQVSFSSGWNRLSFPSVPSGIELNGITGLRASTEGNAANLPSWTALSEDLSSLGRWARRTVPSVPPDLQFRIAGSLPVPAGGPLLTVETKGGATVRVGQLTGAIHQLTIPDLRLEKTDVSSQASGIRTGKGQGDLSFATRSSLVGDVIDVRISEPLSGSLHSELNSVVFDLSGNLTLDPLLQKLDPFLRQAGIALDGVRLPVSLTSLHAETTFGEAALRGFDVKATVAPGEWAALDFSKMLHSEPRFLRSLELSGKAPVSLHLGAPSASFPRLEVAFNAPAVSASLNGGAQQASVSAEMRADLRLFGSGGARPVPVLDRLSSAASALRGHLSRALDVFAPDAPSIEHLRWRADLGGGSRPVLTLEPDGLELALRSQVTQLDWRSAGRASSATASLDLAAHLGLYEGHLIADAVIPLRATLALSGAAPSTWNFRLPLLAALDERLQPVALGSNDLWDSTYYEKLWGGYRPRHATAPFAWIDRGELVLAGLSLQQVTFPSSPFRVAVGYAGPLELHAPASARLLFGRSDGLVQARLTWLKEAASIDTRTHIQWHDLQAGAVGLMPGHTRLLEDTLEGRLDARADGMLVDRRFFSRLLSDPSMLTELDKIGFDLDLHSTGGRPGIMQFQAQSDLRLSNALLSALTSQFQLQGPLEAMRYRNLALRMQVAGGAVETKPLLLHLHDVEIPNLTPVPVGTDIRVHWGRERPGFEGLPLRFRNLLGFFQRMLPARPLQ